MGTLYINERQCAEGITLRRALELAQIAFDTDQDSSATFTDDDGKKWFISSQNPDHWYPQSVEAPLRDNEGNEYYFNEAGELERVEY